MIEYSGWQYLLIDAASQFGLDKEMFESRIKWAEEHLDELETMVGKEKTRPLYLSAVMAIRKAQAGLPTGHLVGMDASASGVQVMSIITGCEAGAEATGLINPNVRANFYATVTKTMGTILGNGFDIALEDAKKATMTSFYGSKKVPGELFGEDTPELNAFYQAMQINAPGAWDALQCLVGSWQPFALVHSWKLPDGFDVRVKVMQVEECQIEVDELNHATFTYQYKVNKGKKKAVTNAANVVHSLDGYALRSIHRRCNYDRGVMEYAQYLVDEALQKPEKKKPDDTKIAYYVAQYERSGMADAVILPYLNQFNVWELTNKHLKALKVIVDGMLVYQPFEVVTIHDESNLGSSTQ